MKTIALLLTLLLLNATLAPHASAAALPPAQKETKAAKVKRAVEKFGTGERARVGVRLNDGTKLKGYVRESDERGFVLVEEKTGAARAVAYEEVRQVGGRNLSTGAKIAIGFGIAAGVLGLLVFIGFQNAD